MKRGCLTFLAMMVLVWLVVGEQSVRQACQMAGGGDANCVRDFPIPIAHLGSGSTWVLVMALLWVPFGWWAWGLVKRGRRDRVGAQREIMIVIIVTCVWYVGAGLLWGFGEVDHTLSPLPWFSAVATTASLWEGLRGWRRSKG